MLGTGKKQVNEGTGICVCDVELYTPRFELVLGFKHQVISTVLISAQPKFNT